MTTFGDVRSAVHGGDAQRLIDALRYYDDTTPAHEVVAYIRQAWGWCPATKWMGSNGVTNHAVSSHICRRVKRLEAKIHVGDNSIVVMSIERPEDAIQEALLPIRKEALDRWWQPVVDKYGTQEMLDASQMLYAVLGDFAQMKPAHNAALIAIHYTIMPHSAMLDVLNALETALPRSPRKVCTSFCGSRLRAMDRVDRHLLGAPTPNQDEVTR